MPDQTLPLTSVFLLTSGDGDEWRCHSIHRTRDSAERAKRQYEAPQMRPDGSTYHYSATIEEWPVEP